MQNLFPDENLQALIPSVEEIIDDPVFEMFSKNSLSTYLLEYGYEQVMGNVEDVHFEDLDYWTT